MAENLRDLGLIDFCTPSIAYDRQVQSGCEAFDNQMHEIIDATDGTPATGNGRTDQPSIPATLSQIIFIPQILALADETLVDILAWQFHVDFYDRTQPLDFRKQLVWNSIQWHMRKGTVKLVEDVLNTFWPGGATLLEWFEYMNPLPPNYPIDNPDAMLWTFAPAAVNVATNTFTINGHGFLNSDQIRFEIQGLAIGSQLPQPLLAGLWYRVVNKTTNTFQVTQQSVGGAPIDLLTQGVGGSQIWKRGSGSWHDRYRFRVLIDETVIAPEDYAQVMALINEYKPVSRWLEGIFRMKVSQCNIGWAGMTLQFIYKESEAPNYP
jgi:P2-related tail formation protein